MQTTNQTLINLWPTIGQQQADSGEAAVRAAHGQTLSRDHLVVKLGLRDAFNRDTLLKAAYYMIQELDTIPELYRFIHQPDGVFESPDIANFQLFHKCFLNRVIL